MNRTRAVLPYQKTSKNNIGVKGIAPVKSVTGLFLP